MADNFNLKYASGAEVTVRATETGSKAAGNQVYTVHTIIVDSSGNVIGSTNPQYAKLTDGTNDVNIVQDASDSTDIDGNYGLQTLSSLYGRINADTVKPIRIDASTHSIQTLEYAHHEIHSGSHFFIKGQQDVSGAGTNLDFLFVVPNTTTWPHAQWNIAGESEFTMSLYEGVVTSNNGSPVTIYNANRNSSNAATTLGYSGPTLNSGSLGDASDGGVLIWQAKIGSGKNATEGRSTGYEIIAKQNTKYWFRFTKIAAGDHYVDYDFNWYEHADKD